MTEAVKSVWVVYCNTDNNEGRGTEYPEAICELKSTAVRLAKGQGVQGSNADIKQLDLIYHYGRWYGPVVIAKPSEDDIKNQKKLDIVAAAEERAKSLGLTDKDIAALRGYMQ